MSLIKMKDDLDFQNLSLYTRVKLLCGAIILVLIIFLSVKYLENITVISVVTIFSILIYSVFSYIVLSKENK
ncbi:hypothetical protein [Gemelliphila palaticanis]|uniref:Uncharacterized protein n=1 Tax=Gemelliphila palaticanis TaxID=81950 RepID=A0ABX2T1L4_9BACL|nr:hypothetical protein [Gemella palaticanis]MBF0715394.1 hypothetical protein [Gemella palaticanis]NYS47324.1 hypothetical protein [Gemella palaticanis]